MRRRIHTYTYMLFGPYFGGLPVYLTSPPSHTHIPASRYSGQPI